VPAPGRLHVAGAFIRSALTLTAQPDRIQDTKAVRTVRPLFVWELQFRIREASAEVWAKACAPGTLREAHSDDRYLAPRGPSAKASSPWPQLSTG
jgi:hypothetical protein